MQVRYLELSVKDDELRSKLLGAVDRVLQHGQVVLGPEVEEFERRVADYCDRGQCIGLSSGSDALYVALRALDIGPGDEIITTPMSWVATLNAIVLNGATPVFVDIGPDLNINAELISEAITPRTKAIVPVHYTGRICAIDRILEIAEERGLAVIEDAAQAFGAQAADGRKAGSMGAIACFSMNAMKVFHSYGEAGAVLCDDPALSEKMASLRYAGTVNRENCHYPSLNFRLQALQAALLLVEFERVEGIIKRRREIAAYYREALQQTVECPEEEPGSRHVYYTFTIQGDKRDDLQDFLQAREIETKIHHPFLMPQQAAFKDHYKPHIPVAEERVQRILSLPNHEKLTEEELAYVVKAVRDFYGS
jgi:dTDP-4-amino-4,6-dideoxygalactose transaminase